MRFRAEGQVRTIVPLRMVWFLTSARRAESHVWEDGLPGVARMCTVCEPYCSKGQEARGSG